MKKEETKVEGKEPQSNTLIRDEASDIKITEEQFNEVKPKLVVEEKKVEETFLDRLRKEKDQLQDKYDKLNTFLNKDDASIKVGYTQYDLLVNQKIVMEKYLEILDKRIEDLDNKEKKADERI